MGIKIISLQCCGGAGLSDLPAASEHSGSDAGQCVPRLPKAGREAGGCGARQLCHVDEPVRPSAYHL